MLNDVWGRVPKGNVPRLAPFDAGEQQMEKPRLGYLSWARRGAKFLMGKIRLFNCSSFCGAIGFIDCHFSC